MSVFGDFMINQAASKHDEIHRLWNTIERLTAERDTAVTLAREAANGWACYAKRQIEHDDISRIHKALDRLAAAARSEEGLTR